MKGEEFRKFAELSFKPYAKNNWFFIRELAQNSRDAGASEINIKLNLVKGKEIISFKDNGCGMSFSHAKKYLFRLYSSSKDEDKLSAGMYGVGFWSILRFDPEQIIISSKSNKSNWKVSLDRKLKIEEKIPDLKEKGTKIILKRPAQYSSFKMFTKITKKAVIYYCRYLRQRSSKIKPLPVFFQGEKINQPMELPGPITLKFYDGSLEGVVGLGNEPSVSLFARGLPVWKGKVLQQLSDNPLFTAGRKDLKEGVAPIFLLNGNDLDVNIYRKSVIDNKALRNVRKKAEKALNKLISIYINKSNLKNKFIVLFNKIKEFSKFGILCIFFLFITIVLIVLFSKDSKIYNYLKNNNKIDKPALSFNPDNIQYRGAEVSTSSYNINFNIKYKPKKAELFKLFTATKYTNSSGFIRDTKSFYEEINKKCNEKAVSVQYFLERGGKILLPHPTGSLIDTRRIFFNNKRVKNSKYNSYGEIITTIPSGRGILRYYCCEKQVSGSLQKPEINKLTKIPDNLKIPDKINKELSKLIDLNISTKVEKALDLTSKLLKYDVSTDTVLRYSQSANKKDWFERVLKLGKGDCDIINSVNIVFLRKMKVPALLAIGLIGRKGKVVPQLHAWTEYYYNGWHAVDASYYVPLCSQGNSEEVVENKKGFIYQKQNINYSTIIYILLFVLVVLFVFLLIYFLKKRKNYFVMEKDNGKKSGQLKKYIYKMVVGSLLYPDAWKGRESIWFSKIIPTINDKKISIKKVLELSKDKKLFVGKESNPLVQYFLNSGDIVLSSDEKDFSSLVELFYGRVNLDRILNLKLVDPKKYKNLLLHKLFNHINKSIKKVKKIDPFCFMIGREMRGVESFDINLDAELLGFKEYKTNKIIAINPNKKKVKELTNLYQDNQKLAIFRTLSYYLNETDIISEGEKQEFLVKISTGFLRKKK